MAITDHFGPATWLVVVSDNRHVVRRRDFLKMPQVVQLAAVHSISVEEKEVSEHAGVDAGRMYCGLA